MRIESPIAAKPGESELRKAFQDFTAGTIFKQMLKSLRKMHDEPAYMSGGQAEETFRGMLDERVAEDLATSHGRAISEPLFQAFQNRTPVVGRDADPVRPDTVGSAESPAELSAATRAAPTDSRSFASEERTSLSKPGGIGIPPNEGPSLGSAQLVDFAA